MRVEKYYTSMEHLLDVFQKHARAMGFRAETVPEYARWKLELRNKLRQMTGLDTMETCELKPQRLESIQMDGYRRDKLLIQTEPDVWMPFYVLIPDGRAPESRTPCVIATHGHASAGKWSVGGRSDIPAVERQIRTFNYTYGIEFVRQGYLVFCPDARAFGERREWTMQGEEEEQFLNSSCTQLNHMALGLGQSVTGMWTWDLMRLADYIKTRDDCGDIACTGLSGGGLQALWLAAMDDRIQCAVVSGYFYGYKDSLLRRSSNCGCNYVPGLWKTVDMGDLGALIAPRALLIESGLFDPLNGERGIDNVTEQYEITRQAYLLLGAEQQLQHHTFPGEHRWNGECTYDFVNNALRSAYSTNRQTI